MMPLPPPDEQRRIAEVWQNATKVLHHTIDMFKSIREVKNGASSDLFRQAKRWKTEPLLNCVGLGHDTSISYPLYMTSKGKLQRTSRHSENYQVGLIPSENLDPYFLLYFLEHKKHSWHSTHPDKPFNFDMILGTLQIPLPALHEQRKIVTIFQQHDDVLHKLKVEHNSLLHLVQGMMQQIFSGNLPTQEAIALLGTL
jgi:restriction endonuclease S subunit